MSEYFQSYQSNFWQWDQNGEIASVVKGSTIAYRPLIVDIINELSDDGLPQFDALLMTMIALNPNGLENIEVIVKRVVDLADFNLYNTEPLSFLKKLANLPSSYKTGSQKLLVLKTIFENSHQSVGAKKSEIIASSFENGSHQSQAITNPVQLKKSARTVTKILGLLDRKFKDAAAIIDKMAGISLAEEELQLEETDLKPSPEELVTDLVENIETYKVGTLVKTLWSGLNLPIHSTSINSEQQMGGVADLTNKGDYDRLLISEFANDDMVFLSRLANNEALFLNREAPPTANKLQRIILIDVSIKNWGTPKLLAFAAMLAIAKHPKTDITFEVFIVHNRFQKINFETVEGLIEGMQYVSSNIDATNGLRQFFEAFPSSKNRELFFLTEKTVLTQPHMLKVNSEFESLIDYWLLSDAEGHIDIYKRTLKSKKHLQKLILPLPQLWKREKKKPVSEDPQLSSYPILVPQPVTSVDLKSAENGEIFIVTKAKKLLRFYGDSAKKFEKGWRVIEHELPSFSHDFEIGLLENGTYIVLLFNRKLKSLYLIDLSTKAVITKKFEDWNYGTFIFDSGHFYCHNEKTTWLIGIDGHIEDISARSAVLEPAFKSRAKKNHDCKTAFEVNRGIFKNITSVGISEGGQLMLNSHVLKLHDSRIRFKTEKQYQKKVFTAKISERSQSNFQFADGSEARNDKNGILTLVSSNPFIPPIYIPLVLKKDLGLATREDFAGNQFYNCHPAFSVKIVKNTSENSLALVKTLKEYAGLGLKAAKEMVDYSKENIVDLAMLFNEREAKSIKSKLEELGAEVEVESIDENRSYQKIISADDFYQKYIQEFIVNIQAYGTED